ncbi:MAG: cell envelope integrity protein CreD [Pseudomonadota bacterium]
MTDTLPPPPSGGPPDAPIARGLDFNRFVPKRSFGLKLLLVCALALLMAIPAGFVWAVVFDREANANDAVASVSHLRGGRQTVLGPVIVVPFTREIVETIPTNQPGVMTEQRRTVAGRVVLYAETGEVRANLDTELLRRGIHDVPVYDVDANFNGAFDLAKIETTAPDNANILWEDARVFLGLSDLRGAQDAATVSVGGDTRNLEPVNRNALWSHGYPNRSGTQLAGYSMSLISAELPGLDKRRNAPLTIDATLRFTGAQRFGMAPFAKDTRVSLEGDWPDPSFQGGFLPQTRTVTETGFSAEWRVPFLARGSQGVGVDLSFDELLGKDLGVLLIDEASPYQSVSRALKYAPMFLGLVFLTYFLFETTSGMRAHPAQYVLVGLAQAVFYLLLLGVSEHLGFTLGFWTAATATVCMLSLYAGSVFRSRKAASKAFGVFTALYALIFVLMRMEDYALLVGSILSFAAIAFTMWATRDLDWYGDRRSDADA